MRNQVHINLKMSGLQFIYRKGHICSGQVGKRRITIVFIFYCVFPEMKLIIFQLFILKNTKLTDTVKRMERIPACLRFTLF